MKVTIDRAGCDVANCHAHKVRFVEVSLDPEAPLGFDEHEAPPFIRVYPDGTLDVRGVHGSAFGYKATLDEWIEGISLLMAQQTRERARHEEAARTAIPSDSVIDLAPGAGLHNRRAAMQNVDGTHSIPHNRGPIGPDGTDI